MNTKDPLSCYQSKAAQIAFQSALYITLAITFFSVLAIPGIIAILGLISRRTICCRGVFESLATSESTTSAITVLPGTLDNPTQIVTTKLLSSLRTAIPTAVSAVSIGWLFNFWEAANIEQAACDYDQDR